MIEITESAANAIRTAIAGSSGPVQGLRLMIETGGCAGNKYMMGLVAEPLPGDVVVESGEVKVFVDAASAPLLQGVTIDFLVSADGAGFTFINPNAKSSCACGKSFA
jgi:iron-sulfur cluster assembly accessory protein